MNNLDVGDILAKEQFKVKLGFTYFLTSGWNLVLFMIFLSEISLIMAIAYICF
ncbi:MAG: hypothetical protein LBP54_08125 [Campylobacteraceae bacterium]|nr:hypothetical protein [Campylobacteraceae bacterium]